MPPLYRILMRLAVITLVLGIVIVITLVLGWGDADSANVWLIMALIGVAPAAALYAIAWIVRAPLDRESLRRHGLVELAHAGSAAALARGCRQRTAGGCVAAVSSRRCAVIARILKRLAVVWVVLVSGWAIILNINEPDMMAHGGWTAVAIGALLPAGLAFALAWAFTPCR